jgi:ribosomal protein L40E
MSKSKSKSSAGRPAGSITDPCPPVKAIPAMCRKCHSADLLRKSIVRDIEHFGEVDGAKTTRHRWTRAMCRNCGQWQVIVEDYNP